MAFWIMDMERRRVRNQKAATWDWLTGSQDQGHAVFPATPTKEVMPGILMPGHQYIFVSAKRTAAGKGGSPCTTRTTWTGTPGS